MAPPKLFLRFALFSGIALAAAVVLALLLARSNVNDRARSRAVGDATAVAKQFASDDLSRTAFSGARAKGSAGDLTSFLDIFFTPTVAAHDPAHVVLYSPQGIVTYATDHSLIGKRATDPARVRAGLDHPQYDVVKNVQYAYAPGRSDYGVQKARGVIRLERNYAPIAAEIHDDFYTEATTIALALVALYLAMLPIMRRVTRSMRRSYVERAELAAIVDYSNDGIIGLSSDGSITSWNAGAETIYGWRAEEVIDKPIDFLLPEVDEHDTPSERDLGRTTHLRKDGTPVAVSVTMSPIRDAKGELVGSSITARDVTELERLDRELREAYRQEAVGRLAGGIAHDFGEVLGEIDAAAANLLLDPASKHDLDTIRAATARGSSLAEQLLAVGGAQDVQPEVIDLNEAIRAAEPKLVELAGATIAVTTELEEALGPVFADREQIEQLIFNLGANARASMPIGGKITVKTANVDFSRRARGVETEPGHYVMFAVSDTGAAIAAEVRERPFEPYYRRSSGGERMALGLAAVCGIVKQSGGTMGVESRPEGGTIIRIYLPRVGATELGAVQPGPTPDPLRA
jgi:PAS domain S-box-containing protein